MLLVDDGEPKIGEDHALLKKGVCADRDVDLPRCQRRQRLASLGGLVAARHQRDAYIRFFRERRDPLEVLAGEHLRRRHHCRLSSRLDHVGHREQRDDGLARADVALQEPNHPFLGPEIGADFVDRLALRAGQRKWQRGLEAASERAFGCMRAARDRPHPGAHEKQGELVGEQFVIGETSRGPAARIDILRRLRPMHHSEGLGEARQIQPIERLGADPFRQAGQALERALGGAGDGALKEALGEAVDGLDAGKFREFLRVHDPVGMNHLAESVIDFELAGDPAGCADGQARADPLGVGEKEHELDVAGFVLDQHLERRARARTGGSRCSVTFASMVTIVPGTASRIFGRERRSSVEWGRWNSTSTTRAPCGLSSRRSNNLAFFGPIPGSVAAGANSGSRRDGRMAPYSKAAAQEAVRARSAARISGGGGEAIPANREVF